MIAGPETVVGIALVGVGALGAGLLWRLRRAGNAQPPSVPAPTPGPSAPTTAVLARTPQGAPPGTLAVQTAGELVQLLGLEPGLQRAHSASELNSATWAHHVRPVFDAVAELVQLLPASESHHHANPGGLLTHLAETMEAALVIRKGTILPPQRDSDEVSRMKHRWTAGLVIVTLLHDIGKPVTDVRVKLYGGTHAGTRWNAIAGSMLDAGALHYAVEFPPEKDRDYDAHQRLGALLMQRIVPAKTLAWLGEDATLMTEVLNYLAGTGTGGPLTALVRAGEAHSVRENLKSGPRSRFATARAVPLIERLMAAMRRMLVEGSHLPLNRRGAAGYVFEGEVWFAAARLANEVRDYLIANESGAGVPGVDKNDRFFDAWQDYGACMVNPTTRRALWGGRIVFEPSDGQPDYELSAMLRFPVELLFPPDKMPPPMAGRIEVTTAAPTAPVPATATPPSPAPAPHSPATTTAAAPVANAGAPTPAPSVPPAAPANAAAAPPQAPAPVAPAQAVDRAPSEPAAAAPVAQFLDDDDSATIALQAAKPPKVARGEQATGEALKPVAPAVPLPAAKTTKGTPSSGAVAFMQWVQRGVADGSLPYNTVGAAVHFVKYGEQMAVLLVSPTIFRQYAAAETETAMKDGDAPGQASQRALSGAGWHVRGPDGKNIWPYQVMRNGNKGGNLLNGFLLLQPERFFDPVPPPNDRLVLWASPGVAPKAATAASTP